MTRRGPVMAVRSTLRLSATLKEASGRGPVSCATSEHVIRSIETNSETLDMIIPSLPLCGGTGLPFQRLELLRRSELQARDTGRFAAGGPHFPANIVDANIPLRTAVTG